MSELGVDDDDDDEKLADDVSERLLAWEIKKDCGGLWGSSTAAAAVEQGRSHDRTLMPAGRVKNREKKGEK